MDKKVLSDMDKKVLADIAIAVINEVLKQIDAVTSDANMNYIVTAVMGQVGLWMRR